MKGMSWSEPRLCFKRSIAKKYCKPSLVALLPERLDANENFAVVFFIPESLQNLH